MHSEDNMQNLEDLCELKNLCMRKLDKLVINIKKYVKGSEDIFGLLSVASSKTHRSEVISAGFIRDSFLSSLTNVLECTLKLNGHLDASYVERLEDVPSYKSLLKIDESALGSLLDLQGATKYAKNDVVGFVPAIDFPPYLHLSKQNSEITSSIFGGECFGYLRRNFNDFGVDCVFNAIITWIDVSYFCICPYEWKETALLISQSMENLSNFEEHPELPPNDEVFGILIPGDGIWRAIRTSDVYANSDLRVVYDIILLDFGEPITIQLKTQTFKLPKQVREQPAQVVYCLLKDGITEEFKQYLFKEITLHVIEMRKDELVVDIIYNNDSNYLYKSKETKPSQADGASKLSEADWKILQEETLNTSNALKAVLGYVPKDEQRICRFFDPKTGNCFKGSSCSQEHTELNQEGFTKDLLPTDTVVQNSTPITIYKKHTKLLISPTYIKSLTHFYAHIGAELKQSFSWNADNLPYAKGFKHAPHTLEMVIAKFEDDLYYRAQILEQFNETTFKVFYVDYGNEGVVDVLDMAPCDETVTYAPHQAVICRIAGVAQYEKYSKNQYEAAKCLLQSRLIDKSFVMKVIDHHDDLVVKFIEHTWKNFPYEMISLGFLQSYEDKL